MASSIQEIMTALETRLDTISGLKTWDFATDNPVFPAAFPLLPEFTYRDTMKRGTYTIRFRVALLVGAGISRAGQRTLAAYASQTGDKSVRAAIEADKTLGGLVEDCFVESFDPTGLQQVGFSDYYGGTFTVPVFASGA
jgi:hypothetical protein